MSNEIEHQYYALEEIDKYQATIRRIDNLEDEVDIPYTNEELIQMFPDEKYQNGYGHFVATFVKRDEKIIEELLRYIAKLENENLKYIIIEDEDLLACRLSSYLVALYEEKKVSKEYKINGITGKLYPFKRHIRTVPGHRDFSKLKNAVQNSLAKKWGVNVHQFNRVNASYESRLAFMLFAKRLFRFSELDFDVYAQHTKEEKKRCKILWDDPERQLFILLKKSV